MNIRRNRTRTAVLVDALMLDATTLRALIDPALTAIDTATSGWPTSTPGANPQSPPTPSVLRYDEDGNPINDAFTATERAALHRDPALTDRKALEQAVLAAGKELQRAAILARKWAIPALDDRSVEKRLAAVDAGIWCENCATHGHKNPRREQGRLCSYCSDFKVAWKQLPPKGVLDLWSIKGRVYESDIRRILGRQRDARKAAS